MNDRELTPEWCVETFYRVNPGAKHTMSPNGIPSLYLLDFARAVEARASSPGVESAEPSKLHETLDRAYKAVVENRWGDAQMLIQSAYYQLSAVQRPAAATAPDTTTFAPWAEGENVACPRCTASVFLMRDGSYRDRKAPAEAGGLHVCAAATAEPPTSLSAEAKLRAQQTATDQQEPARAADVIRSGAPRPLTVPSTAEPPQEDEHGH